MNEGIWRNAVQDISPPSRAFRTFLAGFLLRDASRVVAYAKMLSKCHNSLSLSLLERSGENESRAWAWYFLISGISFRSRAASRDPPPDIDFFFDGRGRFGGGTKANVIFLNELLISLSKYSAP